MTISLLRKKAAYSHDKDALMVSKDDKTEHKTLILILLQVACYKTCI